MKKRVELNEQAVKLMKSHAFTDGNGKALTLNADIFRADVAREFTIFAEFVRVPRSEKEVVSAKAPVLDAISWYNDEMRMQRIEQLKALPGKTAMLTYLDNQCVKGLSMKQNKDKSWEFGDCDTVELTPYDCISEICGAELDGIINCCCIFVDNVAKNEFGEDSQISRRGAHESYIAIRKAKGWELPKDKKLHDKELAAQLTEVCNMISYKQAPAMKKADVKFVKFFVMGARRKANEAGEFVVRNDSTIVNAVFGALYTRKNGKPYSWQNKSGYDKNPAHGVGANTTMAESNKAEEFTGRVEAEAGEITLGTPEA